jgi:hypothetical protein
MAARKTVHRPGTKKARIWTRSARPSLRSKKLAISFDGGLAAQVQQAAKRQSAGNVSAWLAEAARERLRLEAARQLLREYEAEHGAISSERIAEVERQWPRD